MKLKQFFAAALLLVGAGASAQTDVTSTYLTNADFSSMTGWTEYKAASYVNIGSGLIGTFKPTGSAAATVDATHLNTEYCIGFQARWNTNYTAYQQTTAELPVGHYELSYDVEDVNGSSVKINYDNLFYVEVGGNKIIDTKTEWMNAGKSSWTTHTISFDIASPTTVKISLGYGNKEDKNTTPIIYVSHLKLTWTDPEAAAHAAALDAAKYNLNGYIKKATALNGVLANSTLTNAISAAQGVYDEANDWADDYEKTVKASTTLNNAITTALSSATSIAIANGNFDNTPNNTLNGDKTTNFDGTLSTATSNPDNTKDMSANTGDHGYLYEVTGWTQFSKFNSTAAQGTTSEYGTAMPANGWSTNSTTPPATDMFGASAGAALHLSAGWNDQARYQQTIENLPAGRYVLYYEVINQHNSTGIASNYIGVNGAAGDFYGTTDKFVYSNLKTIEQGAWKAQAFEFDVAKTANINFSVGVTTSTGGSGNGAKLWVDNYLVYRLGDVIVTEADANTIITNVEALDDVVYNATIKSALATAKSTFIGSKTLDNYNALNEALIAANESKDVYTALDAAITKVEGWTATTAAAGIRAKYNSGTYTNETTADDIYAEYQADEIAALAKESATDYTSAIINPSFETGDMTGWSAESRSDTGVKENSNSTYTINNDVDGRYIFNSWGGSDENNVYQTIKNLSAGTYQLSALLAGFTGEKLILAANEKTSSVIVSGDKTTGNIVNVIFTLADAADVVIKASNTKATSADASFIKADNFTLKAYNDPLAAYKEQLATLQAEATTTLGNAAYVNVTGSEKTTLKTLSTTTPEETEEAYTTAISGITAAISAFTAAKDSYDALVTEIAYAKTIGVTTADDYAATSESTTASVVTSTQNLKVAEFTAVHYNTPNVVTPLLGTWNQGNYGTTSGQGYTSDESYFDKWNGSAMDLTSSATVTLPAGKYAVKVAGRGVSSTTMSLSVKVGDADAVSTPFLMNGDTGKGIDTDGNTNFDEQATYSNNNVGRGWQYRYITFTTEGEDVTITINGHLNANTWQSFYAPVLLCDNETFANIYAGDAEYTALSNAIDAAEAKTLGFEDGQYAPYNNVAALEALAAAKAIDTEVQNRKDAVVAATTALANATWTDNDGDVDAIYDGTLANAPIQATSDNVVLPGWVTKSGNTRQTFSGTGEGGKACLADAEDQVGLFVHPGTYNYGETTGYTMPLKAGVIYQAEAKYCAWADGSNNNFTLSILKGNTTIATQSFGKVDAGADTEHALKAVKLYFEVEQDGDYVLSVIPGGNTFMTDFHLKKAAAEGLTINEDEDYTPAETYANVTLTRTIKGGDTWNTFVVPFDITNDELKEAFGDDVAVAEFSDEGEAENSVIVNFNTMETPAITANKPVLLKGNNGTSFTFDGRLIKTGDAKVTGTFVDFVGTYDAETTIKAGDYFIGGNKLYKSKGETSLKGTRAYIDAKNPVEVKFFIDGQDLLTGIGSINDAATSNDAIYNLAGQRVQKAQKGLYIVNGKKVIVK